MNPQTYYSSQSRITEPGQQVSLYQDVPPDIAGIAQVARGLVLHYFADKYLYEYPLERMPEIDTRYVPDMLQRITEMNASPITVNRPPEQRIIGCCRDFTALSVSMLRHHGIPARSRYGFADYFVPDYYFDHVVVEFWNGTDWQLADTQLKQEHFDFDLLNVPRDKFVVGGLAWQMCRNGKADPDRFGLGPDSPVRGWFFIQGRLLLDLAGLNKLEMLCWDQWSYGSPGELSNEDKALLDHLAEVSQQGDAGFAEIQRPFHAEARLKLPNPFESYNLMEERMEQVTLR